MSYRATKRAVAELLAATPDLGPERLAGARRDYDRLLPAIWREVEAQAGSREESPGHNLDLRLALLRIVSMESAAGISVDRCRAWFGCLGALAAWVPPDTDLPIDVVDAAAWAALAGQFHDDSSLRLPPDPKSGVPAHRVLHSLVTGSGHVETDDRSAESRAWIDLHDALRRADAAAAGRAFREVADWWLEEYRQSDTPAYDPDNFPTFDPHLNAALAIAMIRDGLDIALPCPEHRKFYFVALMLAGEGQQ